MATSHKSLDEQLAAHSGMRSQLGSTPSGEPLSDNRAPPEELSPWVARIYATSVEMPDDGIVECGMIADTAVLRVLFKGAWTATTRDGHGRYGQCALLFGPQTRRMPVSVRGSFATVGVALKPGAVSALGWKDVASTLDRIILFDHIYGDREWGTSKQMIEWFDPAGPPERWIKVAEKLLIQLVETVGARRPDPLVEAFDKAVLADPGLSIRDFIEEQAVDRRRFERTIKRAYGQTARQVMRRARALDIAAHLRGVADDSEAEAAALKFFDQSHMIREFKAFFGITPRQFANKPQPFMTLTLEARQARRLEVLGRAMPGEVPPWRES